MAPSLVLAAVACLLNACVVGAETRASRPQIASGPPVEPVRADRAAGLLAEVPGVEPGSRGAPEVQGRPEGGRARTAGYYHWNGVRYVYMAPGSERVAPSFRWR